MRNHLYARKHHCPAEKADIELTEEVKEYILNNRIYRVQSAPKPPSTFITNVYNQQRIHNVVNMISPHMTEVTRLQKYYYSLARLKCDSLFSLE
jgi:hypothetical protein